MAADESTISWGPSPTFGELVSGGGGGGAQLVPAETELGKHVGHRKCLILVVLRSVAFRSLWVRELLRLLCAHEFS